MASEARSSENILLPKGHLSGFRKSINGILNTNMLQIHQDFSYATLNAY